MVILIIGLEDVGTQSNNYFYICHFWIEVLQLGISELLEEFSKGFVASVTCSHVSCCTEKN